MTEFFAILSVAEKKKIFGYQLSRNFSVLNSTEISSVLSFPRKFIGFEISPRNFSSLNFFRNFFELGGIVTFLEKIYLPGENTCFRKNAR